MNKDASKIFEQSGCLTEGELLAYLNGSLNEEETHRVEAHMAGCDFCSDALEGLMQVRHKEQIPVIVKQIHTQLQRELLSHRARKKKMKMYIWLSTVIALVLLIALIAFFAIYFSLKREKNPVPPPNVRPATAQVI